MIQPLHQIKILALNQNNLCFFKDLVCIVILVKDFNFSASQSSSAIPTPRYSKGISSKHNYTIDILAITFRYDCIENLSYTEQIIRIQDLQEFVDYGIDVNIC